MSELAEVVMLIFETLSIHTSHYLFVKTFHLTTHWFFLTNRYMLNPYVVAACVSKSTAVFTNLAIVLAVLFTLKGK